MYNTEKSAERNKKRREKIKEHYKINYCLPYVRAHLNKEEVRSDILVKRCLSFKEGVMLADHRYHKWQKVFNDIFDECLQIVYKERASNVRTDQDSK